MLIFKRGHTHINQDDLSEYLDGRLSGTAAARIDLRLTECASCRRDLDALRSTVSLLQQMPELTLPRSFIMPGPPPAPVALRPPAPLRMPQWVYSGAAATAALVFPILVSADATGLLAPKLTAQPEVTAQALRAAPESFQQEDRDGAARAIEMAAPQAPVVNEAISAEKGLNIAVTRETEVAEAEAVAPTLRQAAVPPQTAAKVEAPADTSASAPVAAMAAPEMEKAVESKLALPPPVAAMATTEVEEVATSEVARPQPEAAMSALAVEEGVKAKSVPLTPEVAMAAAKADESAKMKADSTPSIIALTTPQRPPEPTTVAQDSPRGIPPPYNPINIWRVLEGLAAVTAVGFLVVWILRRRAGR